MKNLYLTLTLLFCSFIAISQQNDHSWKIDYKKSKTFIENNGQFDQFENNNTGEIKYAIDFGFSKIFFGNKGVSYSFREVLKVPEEEREEILSQRSTDVKSYKEKEELHGKFRTRADEVNMQWVNASKEVEVIGIDPTSDYHGYTYTNSMGEFVNVNHVKAYKKLLYKNVYPNIDIEYVVHPTIGVKYAFIVHPGADPKAIKMVYDRAIEINNMAIHINTLFGDIIDHAPLTYIDNDQDKIIESAYSSENDHTISFYIAGYDNTKTLTIDPWVQTPNDPNSNWDCVWELDKDGSGNVYVIAGIMPMQLIKYNAAGVLQWTHNTPYDTTAWLGTMATDNVGNSYVTNGTDYMIQKVDASGGVVWNNNNPSGGNLSTEFWNIAFNCDQTKLFRIHWIEL